MRVWNSAREIRAEHVDHQRDVPASLAGFDESESFHALELFLRVRVRIRDLAFLSLPTAVPPPPEQSDDSEGGEDREKPVPPWTAELEERALRLRDALRGVGGKHAPHVHLEHAQSET